MRTRVALVATAALATCALAACASISDNAMKDSTGAIRPPPPTTTVPPPTTTLKPPCTDTPDQPDPLALESYAPNGVTTDPARLPGSTVANIREREYVLVGVDENTRDFSALDPVTGELKGAEITLAQAIAGPIAEALTGDARNVRLVTVVTEQKVPFASTGAVDFTVSAVSMTCSRWKLVDFSSEYYTAQHRLLVRDDPADPINGLADLAGKKVCVTTKSSSLDILDPEPPTQRPIPASAQIEERLARTDCLRDLQRGTVDAFFSHDSILRGMQQQDPNTKIVGEPVASQHYGIAFAPRNTELVRYVNAQLERMRRDGTLEQIFRDVLGPSAPPVPKASYRSAS